MKRSQDLPPGSRLEEAVPLFGNWRNAYVVVILFFLFDVAAFYLFARYFS